MTSEGYRQEVEYVRGRVKEDLEQIQRQIDAREAENLKKGENASETEKPRS